MLIFKWTVGAITGLFTFLIGIAVVPDTIVKHLNPGTIEMFAMLNERETELHVKELFLVSVSEGIQQNKPHFRSVNRAPEGTFNFSQGAEKFEDLIYIDIYTVEYDGLGRSRGNLYAKGKDYELPTIWLSPQLLSFKTSEVDGIRYEFSGKVAVRLTEDGTPDYDNGELVVTGNLKQCKNEVLISEGIIELDEFIGC